MEIKYTNSVTEALRTAVDYACKNRHEFITPEHLLYGLINQKNFCLSLLELNPDLSIEESIEKIEKILSCNENIPKNINYTPDLSAQFQQILGNAAIMVGTTGANTITIPHIVKAIFSLQRSAAHRILIELCKKQESEFLRHLFDKYQKDTIVENPVINGLDHVPHIETRQMTNYNYAEESQDDAQQPNVEEYIYAIEPSVDIDSPHERELTQLITALCRCDNNNVLLVGDPGVGKSELLRKLAGRIANKKVPRRLRNCFVFDLDVCSMISGSQYRGELESRIRAAFDDFSNRGDAIICIDNIHNLMNIGQGNDGNIDMLSVLKPYLSNNELYIIGITTPDDYQRYLTRNKNIIRRFQKIDVNEISEEETFHVVTMHLDKFINYHKVTYPFECINHAIKMSIKYMQTRVLPEKALFILDQAGAICEVNKTKIVTNDTIDKVIKGYCNLDSIAELDDNKQLESLYEKLTSKIFGQNEAIKRIVEAVQMSKAGLLEDNKPIASFLFVGPTGVGKTEVARTLANELGIALQRFDMSEYAESHTIAKLIGSPAGYIGYDDGGLLTSAIQKTPQCVLLLDEIEKAHSDIYNILLQVMDYGQLTDNKGVKTSFQNVIIIMTSNAGAQYAHLSSLGFGNTTTKGSSMFSEVKKIFKPEFINRLSGTIVFNDMNMEMATQILDKKIHELSDKLATRNVKMKISNQAKAWLLKKCYTPTYGARETDRVIAHELKPLFVKEILFGSLTNGGSVVVDVKNDNLFINKKIEKKTKVKVSSTRSAKNVKKTTN